MSYIDLQQRKPKKIDVVNEKPVFKEERSSELDQLLKRKQKVAEQVVSAEANEDAIRQTQKSTVIPPPKRTQEDIDREIAESRKSFYYEKPKEETKKYGFERSSELDQLLKRKQKVAEVVVVVFPNG